MNTPKTQYLIGRCIRLLREQKKLTLEMLANASAITYQYLSGIENGKENFTISVLESIARALEIHPKTLFTLAFEPEERLEAPKVQKSHFRPQTPLPPGLTIEHIEAAANQAMFMMHRVNRNLLLEIGKPLFQYIQGNNFSGLVSNILSDAMNDNSPYKHNHHQRYPDLINQADNTGLEIKATSKIGKGGESHNGHSGWYLIACYKLTEQGDIVFVHLMVALLNGHQQTQPDWKYVGSKVNEQPGSRRTETYVTNAYGTTKLRDGTVYLDPAEVNPARWKHQRQDAQIPPYSIFYK